MPGLNKTKQAMLNTFKAFLASDRGMALKRDETPAGVAWEQGFELFLQEKPSRTQSKSESKPKSPKAEGHRCCAIIYGKGISMADSQCKSTSTTEVDGQWVCSQHAKEFTGVTKQSKYTKETMPNGFCGPCSKIAGFEVCHHCPTFHLGGSIDGTIKPVCFAKVKDFNDAPDNFLTCMPVTQKPVIHRDWTRMELTLEEGGEAESYWTYEDGDNLVICSDNADESLRTIIKTIPKSDIDEGDDEDDDDDDDDDNDDDDNDDDSDGESD